jgi:CheY-like chemotaxis protein
MPSVQHATCDILIVEDDRDLRETLAEILGDEGYDVATVANGREALDYLQGGDLPRLILLDLMMPVMNGWEFRAAQQADPGLARVPVVVFSGDHNVAQKAAALSVPDYLPKPVNVEHLLELVDRYCS